jgi:carbamoyltransferase
MQSVMNLKIKFRESFRPFAPAVLKEHVHEYFEMREGQDSPYMLLVAPVRQDKLLEVPKNGVKGIDKLKQIRSLVPAVTHVDNSARVQTIDPERNPRFYGIVSAFKRKTGCPVVINTSFNVRGEPIVNTAQDAYRCFMATHMDALVVENFVLLKEEQPNATAFDREAYLREFSLD